MEGKMKLLVDAHCFDYQTTEGINTYLKGLYGELVGIAPDIDFYFVAQNVGRIKALFGEAANVHYVPLTSQNKIYRLLFEIPAIVKKLGIEWAHFQYTSPLIKNCKTIVTLHDILFVDYPQMFPWRYRLVKGAMFKLSAKRADLLLTVSDYSRRQIAKHYGISAEEIVVTPNAVSADFVQVDADEAAKFVQNQGIGKYLLYVSRIEPRKNQLAVLKAFHELDLWKKGYHVVFIGRKTLPTPAFDQYYEALADKEKERVHVFNQVSYADLKLWYKAASLFVYPALAEGFGIPPIEAGAVGVPCVCSNRTAMGDFTFFEDNLLDPEDDEALKKAIVRNLEQRDADKLNGVSQQVRSKYNWHHIAETLYRALNRLSIA